MEQTTDNTQTLLTEPENKLPDFTFDQLPDAMRAPLEAMGWKTPMPVQAKAIPYLLDNRDMIVQSRTGSGKTGAFMMPLLMRIDTAKRHPQALVLVPTRELAVQVHKEFETLSQGLPISGVLVYGGVGYNAQLQALREGAQVVIGTPGRVLDHIGRRALNLDRLKIIVFDEADEMLSMGFYPDMRELRRYLPRERSSWMFSATMPYKVQMLAREFLHEPEFLSLSAGNVNISTMEHRFYDVPPLEKDIMLMRLIEAENPESAIIFCNTKVEVEYLATVLQNYGYNADQLSGDLDQKSRERAMGRIRRGETRFLVATDVAARGIDISDLSHVFQYDVPKDPDSYVHRAGRTARAGNTGVVITLVANMSEKSDLKKIARKYEIEFVELPTPTKEEAEARMAERLLVVLEDRFRTGVTRLQRERMKRFSNLIRTLAENDDERMLLAMLLDDLYYKVFHEAPPPSPEAHPAPEERKPAQQPRSDRAPAREPRQDRENRQDRESRQDRENHPAQAEPAAEEESLPATGEEAQGTEGGRKKKRKRKRNRNRNREGGNMPVEGDLSEDAGQPTTGGAQGEERAERRQEPRGEERRDRRPEGEETRREGREVRQEGSREARPEGREGRGGERGEGRREGRQEGREGRPEGRAEGRQEGREGREGRQEGRTEGRQEGRESRPESREGRQEGRGEGRSENRGERREGRQEGRAEGRPEGRQEGRGDRRQEEKREQPKQEGRGDGRKEPRRDEPRKGPSKRTERGDGLWLESIEVIEPDAPSPAIPASPVSQPAPREREQRREEPREQAPATRPATEAAEPTSSKKGRREEQESKPSPVVAEPRAEAAEVTQESARPARGKKVKEVEATPVAAEEKKPAATKRPAKPKASASEASGEAEEKPKRGKKAETAEPSATEAAKPKRTRKESAPAADRAADTPVAEEKPKRTATKSAATKKGVSKKKGE